MAGIKTYYEKWMDKLSDDIKDLNLKIKELEKTVRNIKKSEYPTSLEFRPEQHLDLGQHLFLNLRNNNREEDNEI